MTLREMQSEVHAQACRSGWYDGPPRPPLELLMLMVTELAECAEEFRKPDRDDAAVAEELADVVIRIADAAEYWGLDLQAAIALKIEKNRNRPHRHGDKVY